MVTDWVGSPTASAIYDFLRANGVETRHWVPKRAEAPTQVDHRKILVVDGQRAMTGGMNVADEYRHTWHDVMVGVAGPVVADLQRQFLDSWKEVGGTPIADEATLFPSAGRTPAGDTEMRVLTTQPQESIRQALFAAIDAAQDHINLEVPYFTDDALVDHLTTAARRGVDVQVIVPAASNHGIVDTASRHHYQPLLDAGVHVHLYEGRMTHTKAASVDGVWGTLGSCNGDNLSLRVNRELNVTFADTAVVGRLDKDLFAADMASSRPLVAKAMTWQERVATWAARRLNFTL
jgi:cardiolipin synthase